MNTKLTSISLVLASAISSNVAANVHMDLDECNIELNYDLSISPEHILIIDEDQTQIDIYQDKMLFIKGEQVNLNSEQQRLVRQYSLGIRNAVPEVSKIAVEAVSIAYEGINAALGDHIDTTETKEKFDQLEQRIEERFTSHNGHYSFKQGEFQTSVEDEEVDALVEDIVEEMVPQLIGGIMANMSKAIMSGEADFSEYENIGDNVEKEVEARAAVLEKRANEFCYSLKEVDEIENNLVASNSKFRYFDVLEVKTN